MYAFFRREIVLAASVALLVGGGFTATARADSEDEMRAELDALRARVSELESLTRGVGAGTTSEDASEVPKLSLGGQYRINSYSVDNDDRADQQTASRVRVRQDIDLRFDSQFRTHLQVELGHTSDNVTTTNNSSRGNGIAVRHAVLDYAFENGPRFRAGIVPLSDRFQDTLFSSDWDYNPVALAMTLPLGGGSLRAFAANLNEGSESVPDDDFAHYQVDYSFPLSEGSEINFAAGVATVDDFRDKRRLHANYGVSGQFRLRKGLELRGFVMGSFTERQLLGTRDDASGVAAKLELVSESGLGLMVSHASGDSDGSGFLPVMALASTNGYWGYTGILTVQGPTDTGFDGDSVNVSNNGFGLTSVQVKYARPLSERLDLNLAAGWFGGTDGPSSRESTVGLDFLAMGTYHFNEFLALNFGAAYARLEDSVSGYSTGVLGGAGFNQPLGRDRTKYAFFSRLQAEF